MRFICMAAALLLFSPAIASASCDTAAPAAYGDITYVKVAQYALVGQSHPWFTYEAAYYPGGPHGAHANVWLDARRAAGMQGASTCVCIRRQSSTSTARKIR